MENAEVLVQRTVARKDEWAKVVVQPVAMGPYPQEFVVVGKVPYVEAMDKLRIHGDWKVHPTYGLQFQVVSAIRQMPTTIKGLERLLASDQGNGVGPVIAERMARQFGDRLPHILEHEPDQLVKVRGISPRIAEKVHSSFMKLKDDDRSNLVMWLAEQGIESNWADRIIDCFGIHRTQNVLQQDPYQLDQVPGIAFKTADAFAQRLGWGEQSPQRTRGVLDHFLLRAQSDGHVFLDQSQLITQAKKLAQVKDEDIEAVLEAMLRPPARIVREHYALPYGVTRTLIYKPNLHQAEVRLAERVHQLVGYPHHVPTQLDEVLERVQDNMHIPLVAKQIAAVRAAFANHVSIITGPPGTGKTTTLKALVQTAERLRLRTVLCAPTGRASKRLAELAEHESFTVHRLLGYGREDFNRNRLNPIPADIIVVDEISMLDLEIADMLFEATPDNCSLVLIGDADQLPAVDPGAVLKDLIASGKVPVTTLEHIFRQGGDSLIVQNALRIRQHLPPVFPPKGQAADSYLITVPTRKGTGEDVDWAINTLVELVGKQIPNRMKVNPIRDIQVLVPMKKGTGGVYELNQALQSALNPQGKELRAGYHRFRAGDRVMQTENDYELDIFNGDIGFVDSIDVEHQELMVEFDGRKVGVPFAQTSRLQLAYAQTIHKSQGSEYPVVVLVLLRQHIFMLDSNLLYTANTRARSSAIYLSSPWVLEKAASTVNSQQRNSFLCPRIKALFSEEAEAS